MPIIHTQVRKGSDIIFAWKGLPINKEMTIEDYFYQIVKGKLDQKFHTSNFEVKFGNFKNNITESASIECNAFEAITFYGPYCIIYLKNIENIEYKEEEEEIIEVVESENHQIKGDTKSRQIQPRQIDVEKEEGEVETISQNMSIFTSIKNAKNVG